MTLGVLNRLTFEMVIRRFWCKVKQLSKKPYCYLDTPLIPIGEKDKCDFFICYRLQKHFHFNRNMLIKALNWQKYCYPYLFSITGYN